MKVGIVGLGLIGGSLGLSLKKSALDVEILGFDHNKSHCQDAKKLGLVDEIVSFDLIKSCDVIILAIPVEGIISSFIELVDVSEDTTIIDVGSTKYKITQMIPHSIRKNFVAAHPMAGIEKFGPTAAFDSLYEDQIVVLCDIKESGELQQKVAIDIFENIGMNIVYMGAKEHDLHAAYISHLPHAISYALANSVLSQEDPKSILALAAGGFRSMSRIAKSSPDMWSDVFKQNRENLLITLDTFSDELERIQKMIVNEDWDEIREWMQNATTLHKIL